MNPEKIPIRDGRETIISPIKRDKRDILGIRDLCIVFYIKFFINFSSIPLFLSVSIFSPLPYSSICIYGYSIYYNYILYIFPYIVYPYILIIFCLYALKHFSIYFLSTYILYSDPLRFFPFYDFYII